MNRVKRYTAFQRQSRRIERMIAKGARPRRLLRAINKAKRLDAREQAEMKRLGVKNRSDLLGLGWGMSPIGGAMFR